MFRHISNLTTKPFLQCVLNVQQRGEDHSSIICVRTKELPRILWNPWVRRRVRNSLSLDPIIKQNNPNEVHSSYSVNINFNIILQCMARYSKRILSFRHPHQNPGRTFSLSYVPHAPTLCILLDLTTRIVFVDK
jgi:hypothetical protein